MKEYKNIDFQYIYFSQPINDIAIAYNAGYPVENLQYLVNSYERGEWYCTRKCVYESGNCLK